MINKNIKILEKYCSDYKNIENYEEALTSPLRYDLHHRLEISDHKSRKDLTEENLYYNRPPEELIFLEHGEHISLHKANLSEETRQKISENNCRYWKGKLGPNRGKHCSGETKRKMSDAKKGEKCYMYGKPKSGETRRKMSENNCRYWRGKPRSAETREKISIANKGKHWHLEDGHRIWTD
jgi:hypothetical protein